MGACRWAHVPPAQLKKRSVGALKLASSPGAAGIHHATGGALLSV